MTTAAMKAESYLAGLGAWDATEKVCFTVLGPPVAKERPRQGKSGKFYTPKATAIGESVLAMHWSCALQGRSFAGPVALAAVFYLPTKRRIDSDNLLKALLDGGTKAGAWGDDDQVVRVSAIVEYDPENPRTEVAVCATTSTMVREARDRCPYCGRGVRRGAIRCLHCKLGWPRRAKK